MDSPDLSVTEVPMSVFTTQMMRSTSKAWPLSMIFLPEAKIVYDHFHVHKMVNETIDRVRRPMDCRERWEKASGSNS